VIVLGISLVIAVFLLGFAAVLQADKARRRRTAARRRRNARKGYLL
jgi:hypothetical protein